MLNNTHTMMLGNGNATPTILSRRGTANAEILGRFSSADELSVLEIRQKSTRGRKRHEAVLTTRKVAADPLTAVNSEVSASIGIYFDEPKIGFTDQSLLEMLYALNLLLQANFQDVSTQVVQGNT